MKKYLFIFGRQTMSQIIDTEMPGPDNKECAERAFNKKHYIWLEVSQEEKDKIYAWQAQHRKYANYDMCKNIIKR